MRVTLVNQQTSVSPFDRGLQYGDGFFTTARIKANKIIFLSEHLERLAESAKRLCFPEFSIDTVQHSLNNLPDEGVVKIVVTREQGSRGYAYSDEATINVYIYISEQQVIENKTIKVTWSEVPPSKNSLLGGVKHLNRLDNVMARSQVERHGFDEGIFLDGQSVICGTQSNVFCIKNDQIATPKIIDCGVSGIVRNKVLKWAADSQISAQECVLSKADIKSADAVFFTNCLKGVMSVEYIEQSRFQSHPFIALFQKLFLQEVT